MSLALHIMMFSNLHPISIKHFSTILTTLSRHTPLTKITVENLDHSAQNSTIIYETQALYALFSTIVHFSRLSLTLISNIVLQFSYIWCLQFSTIARQSRYVHFCPVWLAIEAYTRILCNELGLFSGPSERSRTLTSCVTTKLVSTCMRERNSNSV